MKKYEVKSASCELRRRNFKYYPGIAINNDTEQETLATFNSKDEAIRFLDGKASSITTYPSNGLVAVKEYYIEEIGDAEELLNIWNITPLDEDSKEMEEEEND